MTNSPEQAPAGWYDDPSLPGRMRYFDGVGWTNHFHEPGRLPDVGNWVNTTVSVFGRYWKGAAAIALIVTLVGNVFIWVSLRAIVKDIAVVDEEFVNFGPEIVVAGIGVVLIAAIWQGFGWLALNRYMQRAHFHADPTVGEAFSHGLRRLPKYLGAVALILGALMLGMIVFTVLFIAAPLIGVLAFLAAIVLGVWLMVKLTFLSAAIAAAPADAPALRTSADVSTGRFWGVLGRVVVMVIVVSIGANVISSVVRAVGGFGPVIDVEFVSDLIEVEDDELQVRNFRFEQVFGSSASLAAEIALSSIVQAITAMITTSAFMRLYLDSGAPSEI